MGHLSSLVILLAPLVQLGTESSVDDEFVGPPAPPQLEGSRGGELTDEERRAIVFGPGFGERFSAHRLNYAVAGVNDLKMQLSFKYRFVRDAPAFVAFTNVIGWDIYEDSYPYRDINFQPELFYRFDVRADQEIRLDLGYWHNSNGKDGDESRAWDRLFARGIVPGTLWGREFVAIPSLFTTVGRGRRNPDIDEFLGEWELGFVWTDVISPDEPGDDLDLLLNLWGGEGTVQLGLQYRLETYRWNPHLFAQFFSGYGDTLIEYDERKTEFRVGLSFYE